VLGAHLSLYLPVRPCARPRTLFCSLVRTTPPPPIPTLRYELFAVSDHSQFVIGGAHYTAYAKHNGQWYYYDDSSVTECSADAISPVGAYVLFYRHIDKGSADDDGGAPSGGAARVGESAGLHKHSDTGSFNAAERARTAEYIDRMLAQCLGAELVVGSHASQLADEDYDALLPVATLSDIDTCTCTCDGEQSHVPPQRLLKVSRALSDALDSRATALSGELNTQRCELDGLTERVKTLKKEHDIRHSETDDARRALAEAQRLLELAESKEQRVSSEVDATRATLFATSVDVAKLASREERVSALKILAADACAAEEAKCRRWMDVLGKPGAVGRLEETDLEPLLVTLGRCHWIDAFVKHGLTVGMLAGITDGMLRQVVQGARLSRFGDVRCFTLAIKALEAGVGLLPALNAVGGPDARVEEWSIETVAAHFESKSMREAAKQCRELGISGLALLSMERDDVFQHLQLPGGLPAALAFEEVVGKLRAATASPLAHPVSVGRAAAVAAERLSTAVVDALVLGGNPTEFPMHYLRRCTHGFDELHLIGTGAFGRVYRGVDPVSGVRFAVKRLGDERLTATASERRAAERSLRRELEVLLTTRHPNMIRLLGFTLPSADSTDVCLVYELGAHGSIADTLANDGRAVVFDWRMRVRGMAGLASVLNYMHRSHDPPIYHRDVKSANVVLTETMDVKLIDCGLARLLTDEEAAARASGGKSVFTMASGTTVGGGILGTPGYMDPMYLTTGKFGDKAEVFSFGVVMLELLTGKLTSEFEGGLYNHYLHPDHDEREEELSPDALDARAGAWPHKLARELIRIAASCVGGHKRRPTMQAVLESLRALERVHCELTIDEIQRRFSTAQTMSLQVVDTQQRELRERYLKDEHTRQQRDAAAAHAQRTCCICYCEVTVDRGIECSAKEGTPHFVCDDCLVSHVLTESEKDLHDVRERQGHVFCPLRLHGCSSKIAYVSALLLF
jgi:serine/threonine protein kinase